jgi:hypothetical protein
MIGLASCATLAIVLTASVAGAQSIGYRIPTGADERVTTSAFLITYGTTYLVHVYEGRTTANAIQAGAREVNPVVAPFTSRPGMFAFSIARATAVNVAIGSIGKRHKIAAIAIGAALNYNYLFIAEHNNTITFNMRQQRRLRR